MPVPVTAGFGCLLHYLQQGQLTWEIGLAKICPDVPMLASWLCHVGCCAAAVVYWIRQHYKAAVVRIQKFFVYKGCWL